MDQQTKKFDIIDFESRWGTLSEEDKATLIEQAAGESVTDAILPVMTGFISYQFHIRNTARKALATIQAKIALDLENRAVPKVRDRAMMDSATICFRIYSMLQATQALKEQHFYFKTLLSTQGKGAWYAFKALTMNRISLGDAEKIIMTLPENYRLDFIDQYLRSGPSTRLKFAGAFKRILSSVQSRKEVIHYYARLFDRKANADPFLQNLESSLHDPHQVLLREIRSSVADIRIIGLKALAMMAPFIESEVMLDLLACEENQEARIVIYNIIERSAFGQYPALFHPILEMMGRITNSEQLHALPALMVSGKLPLFTVFGIIRDNWPELMRPLLDKLSMLDRLSFLVIQDIALNRDQYRQQNVDINAACLFGLIKKRPERVVRVLKQFDNESNDLLRLGITAFIEKTRSLLEKEKQSISSRFDDLIDIANQKRRARSGLMKSFFSDPVKKKLNLLLANSESAPINFKGKTISNINFSDTAYKTSALYFNRCTIVNCDFSNAALVNAYFKKCIFYNVNMRKTRFHKSSFDYAAFINTNAQGALFKECSFQQVSMFNCNFNRATLKDANLSRSILAKTSFSRCDFTGSTFSHADIAAISFVNAGIEQADFFNVNARFCRFPGSFRSDPVNAGIDYNARRYQLEFKDFPKLHDEGFDKLNMLLFSEFIHYGEYQFHRQNRISLLTAFDIFKPRQAHLFHIIPYLLHENISFPGLDFNIDPKTPFGIYDYLPDKETRSILFDHRKIKDMPVRRHMHPWIDGLFTIGSSGSMAQTIDSDIDYWVCITEKRFTAHQLTLLQQKLSAIERFARHQFQTQVTFFLVDQYKARINDFGGSSFESSGSAQSRLLKEEFYRTMIHVAGKLPLWSILPTPVSLHYYNSIMDWIVDADDAARYIDLGDIHAIPTSEYFGASIWQMFKWLKSPFKSVIKMALLEKYIYEYGKKPLLCNIYKDQWMNSGVNLNLAQNDSYCILLDHLIDYYKTLGNDESVSILLTCFFLKLAIATDSHIDNTSFGLRRILLNRCLKAWGWSKDKVFDIGSFKSWQYMEISQLSTTIENYMVKKYKTVNKAFDKMSTTESQISPEDRTMLGRKVFIEFSRRPGKVSKVLLISRSDRHFSGLHLKYVKKTGPVGTWELVNRNARAFHGREETLIHAKTIEEIGAWLIYNGLYNELSVVNLVPNPTYVTHDDIKKLFKAMYDFFYPILNHKVGFERLLEENRIEHLLVSINFYAPRQQYRVTEYTAVYLNSWGEMFFKSVYSADGFADMDLVRKDITARLEIDHLPDHTAFYFSKGVAR